MSTLNNDRQHILHAVACMVRRLSIIQTTTAQSGHVTSCLSAADIVATLFFYAMQYDPNNYQSLANDRFILSKGHASPVLYAVWHLLGALSYEELLTYRAQGSRLEGHPAPAFPYAEAATGSLGIGLSIGLGEAIAANLDKRSVKIFVLLGDSECTEGSVWETIQLAAHYNAHNLIGIIDINGLGQSTETLYDHHTRTMALQLQSFGWNTIIVDGHDISALMDAYDQARAHTTSPTMILANTLKGYGVSFLADKTGWHGKALTAQDSERALSELPLPNIDIKTLKALVTHPPATSTADTHHSHAPHDVTVPTFKELCATRYAYGEALVALGEINTAVVALDAEVKNSTYAELFEQKFPHRFIQCFIAEQNMLGMGSGFIKQGKIPFISTFGAFFTRAHDQIRMAAIGRVPLRLVGSHCGVSIGQDGPSQMALEDIAMMRATPHAIIVYPCDAVSAFKLVLHMATYEQGISYLRTTREATPILYDAQESFPVGGCKVLRASTNDTLCIVAAGITMHEALKAYALLQQKENPIAVAIIDLYSVQPFDYETVQRIALNAQNRIIVVEDHYKHGGIGEMLAAAFCNTEIRVYSLAVNAIPHSATPAQQLADAHIDAHAIVRLVEDLC